MTAGALVRTGRIRHCCSEHSDRRHLRCCDPADCTPCCPECPTCPGVQLAEQAMPGIGRWLAHHDLQLLTESRERGLSAEAAAALWTFDWFTPRRMVICPPIPQVLSWFRDVQLASPKEPF